MRRRVLLWFAAGAVVLVGAVVEYSLFMVLDAAPAEAFKNASGAMDSTLLSGDRFTIRALHSPIGLKRGDIIAHAYPPDPTRSFVKRIVGMPGDTIAMINGELVLNGRPHREPYAWREKAGLDPMSDDFSWQRPYVVGQSRDTASYHPSRQNWGPLAIPPGMYFVLGDNRDNSFDSRYWGFLPASEIIGKVRRIYFSEDSLGHVRFRRIGLRPH